ncbi:hypothetical protein H5410_049516 [Solanum commersonii]|uniref:Autophagy-related protein n=1 Tax=Solanum commersonii TaxID=4109 RepID=A0A9J5WST7_SOLCO|nr:hypothetical protein H5410_049516 [Solanum commersonii]
MAKSSFKSEHPLERRQAEAARIREKYPDRIPVIVEKAERSDIPDIDKKKVLMWLLYFLSYDVTDGSLFYTFVKSNGISEVFSWVADHLFKIWYAAIEDIALNLFFKYQPIHVQQPFVTLRVEGYLVPADLTVGQFVYVVRKRIKLSAEKAIFIFVKNILPPTAAMMSAIYEEHKDEDGFLYMTYSGENTFGSF